MNLPIANIFFNNLQLKEEENSQCRKKFGHKVLTKIKIIISF